MILGGLSLLLPCLAVHLWLRRLRLGDITLCIALSMGLALGLASAWHYLWLTIPGARSLPFWLADTVPWLLIAVACRWIPDQRVKAPQREPANRWLLGCVSVLSICLFAVLVIQQVQFRHGTDDALAMWNLNARALHLDPHFQSYFTAVAGMDPGKDYPLLVPATVARLWTAMGEPAGFVPGLVAIWFTIATALLCYATVAQCRGLNQGLLALLALLGTSFFVKHGGSQYADVPLSFFVAATLCLLQLDEESSPRSTLHLVLAGISASLAAWTKNEGVVFILALFTAHALITLRRSNLACYRREVLTLLAGMTGMLLVIASFKLTLAPTNHLVEDQTLKMMLSRLTDPARHAQVIRLMAIEGFNLGKAMLLILPTYFLLMGRSRCIPRRGGWGLAVLTLAFVLAGYYLAFATSRYPLDAHINSSAKRIYLHLWPALLATYFLRVASPEEPAATDAESLIEREHRPSAAMIFELRQVVSQDGLRVDVVDRAGDLLKS